MAVTLKDIAAHLGISHMTVSTALSGRGRVSDDTRQRVLAAAQELGYRVNTSARSIRVGRFGNVGLLLSDVVKNSYLPAGLLRGIQIELEKRDIQLTVGRLPDEMLTREGYVPALLRHWSADGLLINYQEGIPQRMAELIEQESVPAVWINSRDHHASVYIDDYQCGRLAAEALLKAGHTCIGYVDYSHGTDDWATAHYSVRERFNGVVDAMRDAGRVPIDLRESKLLLGAARRDASHRWLARPDRPTAVVAYSATTGIPVVVAAWQRGLSVPSDLSIICIDDNPNSNLGTTFTTVITPVEKVGRRAAEAMLARLEDSTRVINEAVAGHLSDGETLARPASA